jgi:hypothetical protein
MLDLDDDTPLDGGKPISEPDRRPLPNPAAIAPAPLRIESAGKVHQDGELYVFRFNRELTPDESTWLYETLRDALAKRVNV